jgi:hypothetical protein
MPGLEAAPRHLRWLWPLVIAFGVWLILVTLPRLPIGTDNDSSWSATLDYAHQNGLQFGKDIAFTYGPLGFLMTPYASPFSPGLRVATDCFLTALVVAGFILLSWRLDWLWRGFAIALFVFFGANADPRNELLICIGLLSWGQLSLLERRPLLGVSLGAFGLLVIFSVLAKMTLLAPAVLSVGAVAGGFCAQRRFRDGSILLAATVTGILAVWVGLGQSLGHLGLFLFNGVRVAATYDQAMWVDPFPVFKWWALAMLALTLGAAILLFQPTKGDRTTLWSRRIVLGWLVLFLYVIWKHGFVRAGRDHLEVFFGCVPVLAALLEAWPGARGARRWLIRGLACSCCVIGVISVQWLFGGDLGARLARPFRLAALHASQVFRPSVYRREMRELQQAERDANQLPRVRAAVGRSSVDVFGCNQAYAVFNDLNFRPRPIFLSYAAYSAALMNLNDQYYFSPAAPQYVLFSLNPIDDRFPPLEDARLLRNLLINYHPVDAEGPILLLKAAQSAAPAMTLLREGTLGYGDVIGLKEYGNASLWLEIQLKPNLLGRLVQWLYRPSEITLAVWCDTPTVRVARFHSPAPMLAAGFLASPLPLDNSDMLDLYTGKPILRPSAYSIELTSAAQRLWKETFSFRLYRIDNSIGNSAPPELTRLRDFPGFEVAPQEVVAARHTMITIAGKPALYLPPSGYMKFAIPGKARLVQGSFGFAPPAYVLGSGTEGAEFRIEEERPEGSPRVLYSQTLRPRTNPGDRGMKTFSVACPETGTRRLIFRALPLGQKVTALDLTCWGDIRFR